RADAARKAGAAASARAGSGAWRVGVMDMNSYLVEWLAKERLGELRAARARQKVAAPLREPAGVGRRLRDAGEGPGGRPRGERVRARGGAAPGTPAPAAAPPAAS